MKIAENVCKNYIKGYYKVEIGKIENGKSGLGLVVERFAIVVPMADSIRDSIRTQTTDSQVPTFYAGPRHEMA